MFKTHAGPVEDEGHVAYLRPETAQGMFTNFANVLGTTRKKPPFGIAQVGKSFRNEITPQNFVFRTREFEQMEMEYFVPPDEAQTWFDYWLGRAHAAGTSTSACRPSRLRLRHHEHERALALLAGHGRRRVRVPLGLGRARGHRQPRRLRPHRARRTRRASRSTTSTPRPTSATRRYVIEPAAGATRTMMAFLLAAYSEDEVGGEARTVLRLHWRLAPYQVAVLPLSKKDTLEPVARQVLAALQPHFMCDYDVTQSIGRRYRRQDEVGTPWCVTVDFDSLEDDAVTVRDRDTHRAGARPDRRPGVRVAPAHRRGVAPPPASTGGRPGIGRTDRTESAQATLRYLRTAAGARTTSRPAHHSSDATTAPESCRTPPTISDRAALTTWVTGWW